MCGVAAGVVIAVMAVTGIALVAEKPVLAWAERAAAHIAVPAASATAQPLTAVLRTFREANPEAHVSGIVLQRDPTAAILVNTGRDGGVYVDPYTADARGPTAAGWRSFFHTMEDWHRALGRTGDSQAAGRAVTGVANVAFLVLAVTGLYLWWPTRIGRLRWRLGGKARDWNWHHATGVWCAPVLIVLTVTGMVMSYRWANNLVYTLSGSKPPAGFAGRPTREAGPGERGPRRDRPGAGANREHRDSASPRPPVTDYDALVRIAAQRVPDWETITLRLDGPRPDGNGGSGVSVSIRPRGAWPLFATRQLTLDPATGAILRDESFTTAGAGRKIRSWIRFLHTGEAFGGIGQSVAAAATLGGLVLVVTGLSLACRRFFGR